MRRWFTFNVRHGMKLEWPKHSLYTTLYYKSIKLPACKFRVLERVWSDSDGDGWVSVFCVCLRVAVWAGRYIYRGVPSIAWLCLLSICHEPIEEACYLICSLVCVCITVYFPLCAYVHPLCRVWLKCCICKFLILCLAKMSIRLYNARQRDRQMILLAINLTRCRMSLRR